MPTSRSAGYSGRRGRRPRLQCACPGPRYTLRWSSWPKSQVCGVDRFTAAPARGFAGFHDGSHLGAQLPVMLGIPALGGAATAKVAAPLVVPEMVSAPTGSAYRATAAGQAGAALKCPTWGNALSSSSRLAGISCCWLCLQFNVQVGLGDASGFMRPGVVAPPQQ
jgi:hypothetical protein